MEKQMMYEDKRLFVRFPSSSDMTQDMLKSLFHNYGVTQVQQHPTYALVDLSSKQNAVNAIKDISTKPPWKLNISFARKKNFYDSNRNEDSTKNSEVNCSSNKPYLGNKIQKYAKNKGNLKNKLPGSYQNTSFNGKTSSTVTNSSSENGEAVESTSLDPLVLWLDKELPVVRRIMHHKPAKDIFVGFFKQIVEESKKYSGPPQFYDDAIEKMNQFLDELIVPYTEAQQLEMENNRSKSSREFEQQNSPPEKTEIPTMRSFRRKISAGLCKAGRSMILKTTKQESSGIVCSAIDPNNKSMVDTYSLLFEEFTKSCNDIKEDATPIENKIMAIKGADGAWYRAMLHTDGWALLDEGIVIPADQIERTVECPVNFKKIPEFACYLQCNPVDIKSIKIGSDYTLEVEHENTVDGAISVKVTDKKECVSFKGLLMPWSQTTKSRPNGDTSVPPEKTTAKSVESLNKRISIIDTTKAGDEMQLTLVQQNPLGQVCIMYDINNPNTVKLYESLVEEFGIACEKEESCPVMEGRVMAVRLIEDSAWYRSVAVSEGWALLDDGRIISTDKTDKCVMCPKQYYSVPEFCVILTNVLPLKTTLTYNIVIVEKASGNCKTRVKIFSSEDSSNPKIGYVTPFAEFREEQKMAQLLDEKVKNSMIMSNVKASCLSKLSIRTESQVVMVNHIQDIIYLRLYNENAKKNYIDLLDELTLSGPKLSSLATAPEVDDLVVCQYENQYHRAIVEKYHPSTSKCSLKFIDIGYRSTVSCSQLKIVPVCATETPVMTDSFTLSNVTKNDVLKDVTQNYLSSLIEKQTPLKCLNVSLKQVVLVLLSNNENVNDTICRLATPEWMKIDLRNVLSEPAIMEQDMKYYNLKRGQNLKILHILDKALSMSAVDDTSHTKFSDLTKEINNYCNKMTEPYLPRIEELCLFKDEASGSWHRGCTLEICDNDMVAVSSLDYGGASKVHFSKCRKMLKPFCDPLPFLAFYVLIEDIGTDPSDSLFSKTCKVLQMMENLVVESATVSMLGVYSVKFKGLSVKLREEGLI